ncbi:MAG: rhodanese-like domain-containing protein [Hyphomicrobiaceae bacterium]
MPQSITLSAADLVAAARAQISELTPQEAIPLVGQPDVVLVDIRDVRELDRDGRVPGSFHCPRGMLEFWIDPASPYHKTIFAEDKRFVFFCGGGMRSVLATKVAQDMGLKPVAHIIDGFAGWKSAGGPIDKTERKTA